MTLRTIAILTFAAIVMCGAAYADILDARSDGYVTPFGGIEQSGGFLYLTQTTASDGTKSGYKIVVKFDISALTHDVATASLGTTINFNQMPAAGKVIVESILTTDITQPIAADYSAAATPLGATYAWSGSYTGPSSVDVAGYINEARNAGHSYVAFRFQPETLDYWPPVPPTGSTTYSTRIYAIESGTSIPYISYTLIPEPATFSGLLVVTGLGLLKRKHRNGK